MIHISFNIDGNYVKHCAVTMVSLFENNKEEEFCVHLVATGLSETDEAQLTQIVSSYKNQIIFYTPDQKLLEGFSIRKFSKRITMATYYRCILADLLPKDIDKVIYMDCDIVIRGNIVPFWNTTLEGVGVAAVEDIGCNESSRYEILQYPQEESYFNAGVLLINLDYWRQHNMTQSCIDYYHKYPERILYNDQDLLNSILHKNKKMVDLCWNVQDGFYRNPKEMTPEWRKKFTEILKNPIILHYTNRKPWDYDSQHPLRMEYFKYLDKTPWKDERSLSKCSNRIKRFFRLLPFTLKLRRPKYVNLCNL